MTHVDYSDTWIEATPTSTIVVHIADKVPLPLPGRIGIWALLLQISRHAIYGSPATAIPVLSTAPSLKPYKSFVKPLAPTGKAKSRSGEQSGDTGMTGIREAYTT